MPKLAYILAKNLHTQGKLLYFFNTMNEESLMSVENDLNLYEKDFHLRMIVYDSLWEYYLLLTFLIFETVYFLQIMLNFCRPVINFIHKIKYLPLIVLMFGPPLLKFYKQTDAIA